MIQRIAIELGPWSWWVLGLVLLTAEVMLPGVFLIWIGLAALLTGILSLILWDMAFWIWEVQLVVFSLLSLVSVFVGRRFVVSSAASDEPLLNKRGESLVGRTAVLEQPIAEGRGRIRLDDTTWVVEGPDLPAGTRVRIVASNGRQLTVEPA